MVRSELLERTLLALVMCMIHRTVQSVEL